MILRYILLMLFCGGLAVHAKAQLISFTFDDSSVRPDVSSGLLEVSDLQISSGNLLIGTASTPDITPPYAQGVGWAESDRAEARYFYVDILPRDGFAIDITGIELLAHATASGPSVMAVQIGDIAFDPVDLPAAQTVHLHIEDITSISSESSLRVKVQAWLNDSRPSSGQGQFRIDDIHIYGQVRSVSEAPGLPVVAIPEVLNTSTNMALITGGVLFDGNQELVRAGLIIGSTGVELLSPDEPETMFIPLNSIVESTEFEVLNLHEANRYTVRMFAENASGSVLSEPVAFATKRGFDGSMYRSSFVESDGFITGPEWILDSEAPVAAFGAGTAGGLRHSQGILGYQLTSILNQFQAELQLINTTGVQLEQIIIGYTGLTERVTAERSPQWQVAVNGTVIDPLSYTTIHGTDRPGIQHIIDDIEVGDGEELRITWTTEVVPGSGIHRQIGLSDVHVGLPSVVDLEITGDAGWRMFSAPFWYPSVSVINDISPIQGYAEQQVPVNVYTGYNGVNWVPLAFNDAVTEPGWLRPGSGFLVYVFDNEIGGSVPIGSGRSIPVVGIEHQRDVTIPVHSDGDRWNLLGNPFETAFDITALLFDGEGAEVVQVWQDAPGRSEAQSPAFGSWVLSNSSTLNNRIPAGQGFMWQNSEQNPSSTVTFPLTGKADITGTRLRMQSTPRIEFIFTAEHENGFEAIDKALQLVAVSDEDNLALHDITKLGSLSNQPQAMFLKEEGADNVVYLAQKAIPMEFNGLLEIPLLIDVAEDIWSNLTLSWPYWLDIPSYWDVALRHSASDTLIDLRKSNQVNFSDYSLEIDGWSLMLRNVLTSTAISAVELPAEIHLSDAFPNPFNPSTNFELTLPENSDVRLEVFDMLGRSVQLLTNEHLPAGRHVVNWNAAMLNSGVYIVRMRAGNFTAVRKVTLIK